jgi:hypothetical protein
MAIRPRGPLDAAEEIGGAALETLFLQQLRAVNDYLDLGYALHYWRTAAGDEVDFVLYGERGLVAFEVKMAQRVRPDDLRGLLRLRADYPQAKAFLVYEDDPRGQASPPGRRGQGAAGEPRSAVIVYLDSSAVLRVLLRQSPVLDIWGRGERAYSSELLHVEVCRVIDRLRLEGMLDDAAVADAHQELARIEQAVGLIPLARSVLLRAALPMATVVPPDRVPPWTLARRHGVP